MLHALVPLAQGCEELEAIDHHAIHITQNAVEVDDHIVTSRGPGTAMGFTLTLIALLMGKDKRDEVSQQLVR